MPEDSYTFRVTIEGADAVQQAQQIRRALETEFKQVTTVLSLGNLPEARQELDELRKSARQVGTALTGGFRAAVSRLIGDITKLQEQVNMVVRGGAGPVEQALDNLGVMGLDALGMVDTGATETTQKMARLTNEIRGAQTQIEALQKRIAELGAQPMIPAGSLTGEVQTLDALFKEMTGSRMPQVRRMFRDMSAEMGPVTAQLQQEAEAARREAAPAYERLKSEVGELQAGLQEVLDRQSQLIAQSQTYRATAEWKVLEEEAGAYRNAILQVDKEMAELRSTMMGTAQSEAWSQLAYQQRQYLEQLAQSSVWWKELTAGAGDHDSIIQAVAKDNRDAGAALAEMVASWQTIRKLQTSISRGIGTMGRMTERIELPPGTEGTLATLVIAEKALGTSTKLSTDQIAEQRKELTKLAKALDQAAQQADGLDRVQRKALQRLQMVGERELVQATKERGITTEEAITRMEPILVRVAQQTEAIKNRTLAELVEMEAEGQRKKPFGFLIQAAQSARRLIVGQSIIPEMVVAINEWLAQIGIEKPFTPLAEDANKAADAIATGLQERLKSLSTEQAEQELRDLRQELTLTATAIESQLVSTGEASQAYKRAFADYAAEVQRVRGEDPQAMALIAQGKVLRGTGIRGEFKTMEIIDEGYQAIQTQVEERQRFSQEEQEKLLALEVKYTGLKQAEYALDLELAQRRVASLEKCMAEALDTGDVDRYEALNQEYIAESDRVGELMKEQAQTREMLTARLAASIEEDIAQAQEQARRTIPTGLGTQVGEALVMPHITQTQVKNALAYSEALGKVGEAIRAARGELPLITEQEEKRAVSTARALAQAEEAERRHTATVRQQLRIQEIDREEAAQKGVQAARGAADAEAQVAKALAAKLKSSADAAAYEKKQQARAAAAAAIEEERRLTAQLRAEEARRTQDHQDEIRKRQQAEAGLRKTRLQPTPADIARYGGGFLGGISYGVQEAQAAQMGIRMLTWDVQHLGRSLTIAGAAMTGPPILAMRRFTEYTRGTDRSARAMGLARDQSEYLREAIIEQSKAMALASPEEISAGMYAWVTGIGAVARNEKELQDTLQQTIPIQQMSYMQQVDLGNATAITAGIMAEYRMEVDQTQRVVEVLSATADRTFAQVEDLGEAFKFVGPIANDLGITMEETAAAFGILADANIRGSMAGRAMRQLLISMADPTKEEEEALNKLLHRNTDLGQSWRDLAFPEGKFIGLAKWIDLLAAATADLTSEERAQALSVMATANELPALTSMVSRQIEARQAGINVIRAEEKILRGVVDDEVAAYAKWEEELTGNITSLESAHDAYQRKIEDMEQSESYRLDQMQRRWDAAMLTLGKDTMQVVLPALERVADVAEDLADFVAENPWIAEAVLVAGGVLTAVGLIATTTSKLMRIVMVVRTVGTMIEGWKAAQAIQATAAAEQAAAATTQVAAGETQMAAAQMQTATNASLARSVLGLAGAVGLAIGALKLYQMGVEKAGIPEWQQTQMARGTESYEQYLEAMRSLYAKGQMEELTEAQWEAVHAGRELGDVLEETGTKGTIATHDIAQEMKDLKAYERQARQEAQGLGSDLMEIPPAVETGLAAFTEEELEAIDALEAYLERRNEMVDEQNEELLRMEEDFKLKEADHYADYLKDREKLLKEMREVTEEPQWQTTEEYKKAQKEILKAQEDAAERRAEIERDFQRKMRDLREGHEDKMEDLEAERDARGIIAERRRYARAIRDAQENRTDQLAEVGKRLEETRENEEEQLRESRERRRKDLQDKLDELDANYAAEAAKRQRDYDRQREERLLRNQEELQDLEKQHAEKLARIMGWEDQVTQALRESYIGRELDLRKHLAEMELMYKGAYDVAMSYQNQMSALATSWTQRRGEWTGLQAGGYAPPGLYRLGEEGREFVVSAPTTRALERAIGPLSQGRLAQMAHVGYTRLDIRVTADQHFSPEFAAQTEALVQEQVAQLALRVAGQQPAAYRPS